MDIRIHTFLILLLGVAVSYGSVLGSTGGRGFSLWLLLLLALAIREIARAIAAAWLGLDLRALLLLPTGALMTFGNPEATEREDAPDVQRYLALVGPLANIGFGLLLAAIVLTVTPQISLLERPWIALPHLLRSAVWINLLLGGINLLPVPSLDGGRLFHRGLSKGNGILKGTKGSIGLGQMIALALVIGGLIMSNMWLILIGGFVLIGSHMEGQGMLLQNDTESVRMRDVMLTEFSMLSASDTLEDALQRSVHTLQDVFPVVRGPNLVGAVSRQGIVDALQSEGNGYIQGVMTRSFQTAQPDDSLVKTLKRIMTGQVAQMVPILEGNRIVGIITPQNLNHALGLLNQRRRLRPSAE